MDEQNKPIGIITDVEAASREFCEQKTYEEIKKRTYIDPLYDAGFKAFLSDEQALVSFLNGVFHLEGVNRIVSVTVKNTELNFVFPQVKNFRLDIRATTSNGFSVNVEMQKAKHSRFIERILLQHSAFMLQSKYEWDQEFLKDAKKDISDEERARREEFRYEIPPTYAIWICDFHVDKQDSYRGTWAIRNEKGLTVTEDRWLYLLKHAGAADTLPDFDDDVISRAIKRIMVKNAPDGLIKEQARNMVLTEEELDHLAAIRVRARREGLAEGRAEGRADAHAEDSADTEAVLREMGLSEEQIVEARVRLEAKRQARSSQG